MFRKLFLFILLALTVLLVSSCGNKTAEYNPKKLQVVASIPPLQCFAKAIGGELVQVRLMIPPGASPHTYQPTTEQMKQLSNASVLVLNGMKLEFWADKAIDAANNPKLIVVKTSDGFGKAINDETDEDVHGDKHGHSEGNPHIWLDPVFAIHQVKLIRDKFIKADQSHKTQYTENAKNYIDRLNKLDKEISDTVKNFKHKKFVAFHPAWIYFANRYGLVQAAVIEESPGKEPSPTQLNNVIENVKKIKAKAIFAEPQFSTKAADVIAEETGIQVLILDPLGKNENYDYISNMRENLKQMSLALK